MSNLVDLAEMLSEDDLKMIGQLTVLLGRLEHMILIAIKRKRGISLEQAEKIYQRYTLGNKLNGKGSEPGLKDLSKGDDRLSKLCDLIDEIALSRNRLIHGLITTVTDETVVIDRNKIQPLSELSSLEEEIMFAIGQLNELVPSKGVHAMYSTGPTFELHYDSSATYGVHQVVHTYEETE